MKNPTRKRKRGPGRFSYGIEEMFISTDSIPVLSESDVVIGFGLLLDGHVGHMLHLVRVVHLVSEPRVSWGGEFYGKGGMRQTHKRTRSSVQWRSSSAIGLSS